MEKSANALKTWSFEKVDQMITHERKRYLVQTSGARKHYPNMCASKGTARKVRIILLSGIWNEKGTTKLTCNVPFSVYLKSCHKCRVAVSITPAQLFNSILFAIFPSSFLFFFKFYL